MPSCACLDKNVVSISLAILALFGTIVGFALLISDSEWILILDKVISCLFLVDIVFRVITEGIEDYFNGEWNLMDCILILLCLLCSLAFNANTLSGLFKIVRSFRVFPILKAIFQSECLEMEFDML